MTFFLIAILAGIGLGLLLMLLLAMGWLTAWAGMLAAYVLAGLAWVVQWLGRGVAATGNAMGKALAQGWREGEHGRVQAAARQPNASKYDRLLARIDGWGS